MTLALALYQPDIAPNAGTLARMSACFGLSLHIIEPAGFPVGDAGFRRAGMDYLDRAAITRHASFAAFEAWRAGERRRLILCTTRGAVAYTAFAFAPDDVLLLGRRRAGRGASGGRCANRHPAGGGRPLAQCRAGGRDDSRRGAAADGGMGGFAVTRLHARA